MNCQEAQQRWHDRVDNGGDDTALNRHLGSCEPCRSYSRQMSGIVGALDQLRIETESVVSRTVAAQGAREPRLRLIRRSLVIHRGIRVAAAVAIITGMVLYYRFSGSVGPPLPDTIVEVPVRVDQIEPDASPRAIGMLGITLRDETAERMMAVARPTSHPDVQMYCLYPKRRSGKRKPSSRLPMPSAERIAVETGLRFWSTG